MNKFEIVEKIVLSDESGVELRKFIIRVTAAVCTLLADKIFEMKKKYKVKSCSDLLLNDETTAEYMEMIIAMVDEIVNDLSNELIFEKLESINPVNKIN